MKKYKKIIPFIISSIAIISTIQAIEITQQAHVHGGAAYIVSSGSCSDLQYVNPQSCDAAGATWTFDDENSQIRYHAITVGQPIVTELDDSDSNGAIYSNNYSMYFGMWSFYLQQPHRPEVVATVGELDSITVSYSIDVLSPPATGKISPSTQSYSLLDGTSIPHSDDFRDSSDEIVSEDVWKINRILPPNHSSDAEFFIHYCQPCTGLGASCSSIFDEDECGDGCSWEGINENTCDYYNNRSFSDTTPAAGLTYEYNVVLTNQFGQSIAGTANGSMIGCDSGLVENDCGDCVTQGEYDLNPSGQTQWCIDNDTDGQGVCLGEIIDGVCQGENVVMECPINDLSEQYVNNCTDLDDQCEEHPDIGFLGNGIVDECGVCGGGNYEQFCDIDENGDGQPDNEGCTLMSICGLDENGGCNSVGEQEFCADVDEDGWGYAECYDNEDCEGYEISCANAVTMETPHILCDNDNDGEYNIDIEPDCFNVDLGDAFGQLSGLDECGVCAGDNSTCTDCAGVVNGLSIIQPYYVDVDGDGQGGDYADTVCDDVGLSNDWVANDADIDDECFSNNIDSCGECDGPGIQNWCFDWDEDGFGDENDSNFPLEPNCANSIPSQYVLCDLNEDGVNDNDPEPTCFNPALTVLMIDECGLCEGNNFYNDCSVDENEDGLPDNLGCENMDVCGVCGGSCSDLQYVDSQSCDAAGATWTFDGQGPGETLYCIDTDGDGLGSSITIDSDFACDEDELGGNLNWVPNCDDNPCLPTSGGSESECYEIYIEETCGLTNGCTWSGNTDDCEAGTGTLENGLIDDCGLCGDGNYYDDCSFDGNNDGEPDNPACTVMDVCGVCSGPGKYLSCKDIDGDGFGSETVGVGEENASAFLCEDDISSGSCSDLQYSDFQSCDAAGAKWTYDLPGWVLNCDDNEPLCANDNLEESAYDECGVCGGDGIANGACNCEGHLYDECGVCGSAPGETGPGVIDYCIDADGDGIGLVTDGYCQDCDVSLCNLCQSNACVLCDSDGDGEFDEDPQPYCPTNDEDECGVCGGGNYYADCNTDELGGVDEDQVLYPGDGLPDNPGCTIMDVCGSCGGSCLDIQYSDFQSCAAADANWIYDGLCSNLEFADPSSCAANNETWIDGLASGYFTYCPDEDNDGFGYIDDNDPVLTLGCNQPNLQSDNCEGIYADPEPSCPNIDTDGSGVIEEDEYEIDDCNVCGGGNYYNDCSIDEIGDGLPDNPGCENMDLCGVCGGSCSDLQYVDPQSCDAGGATWTYDGQGPGPPNWCLDIDGDGLGECLEALNENGECDSPGYESECTIDTADYVSDCTDLQPDCITNDEDECGNCAGEGCADEEGIGIACGDCSESINNCINFPCDCNGNLYDSCGVCDGLGPPTWCSDDDGDGLGDPNDSNESCEAPDGWVNDCKDSQPDCSTNDEDECGLCGGGNYESTCTIDEDNDGIPDDSGCTIMSVCGFNIDGECDTTGWLSWYLDMDDDGLGDPSTLQSACNQPDNPDEGGTYVENDQDLDDNCPSNEFDCNGDCDGEAEADNCQVCTGGNTGYEPNFAEDDCGDCFGENECIPRFVSTSIDDGTFIGFNGGQQSNEPFVIITFSQPILFNAETAVTIESSQYENWNYDIDFNVGISPALLSMEITAIRPLVSHDDIIITLNASHITSTDGSVYFDANADDVANDVGESMILNFSMGLLGDHDLDSDIDHNDVDAFVNGWTSSDPSRELGPFTGTAPYLIPEFDEVYNIDDMMGMIMMWDWYSTQVESFEMARIKDHEPNADYSILGNQLTIDFPDIITDVTSIHFVLSTNNQEITFEWSESLGTLFDINLNRYYDGDDTYEVSLGSLSSVQIDNMKLGTLFAEGIEDNIISIGYEIFGDGGEIITSGTQSVEYNPIPDTFEIISAYPNPFNPQTTILYGLDIAGNVDIIVYDITGGLVDTIYSGMVESGYHEVSWDASASTSGIYFIQFRTQHSVSNKKVVLIK